MFEPVLNVERCVSGLFQVIAAVNHPKEAEVLQKLQPTLSESSDH